jgi:hypothetical protein
LKIVEESVVEAESDKTVETSSTPQVNPTRLEPGTA